MRTKKTTEVAKPIELQWEVVESETIEAFAYVAPYRDLVLRFKSGGSYVYRDVDPAVIARLRKRHPWHEVGNEIKQHPYEPLAKIRTTPRKPRVPKEKKK